MKSWKSLVLTTLGAAVVQVAWAQGDPPLARTFTVTIESGAVTVLHLRTGYITSVRVPEAVNAVVLGDPAAFKANIPRPSHNWFFSNRAARNPPRRMR